MEITKEEFKDFLKPYKDEHIYLDHMEIDPEKVEVLGVFHRGRYPYSKESLDYLAGSEAILFITQLIYAMSGVGLKMQLPVGKGVKAEVFLNKVGEDKVHLTHIDIRFRKKVEKRKGIPVRLQFKSMRKIKNSVHLKVGFDFDNSFFGTMSAVILL